MSNLAGRAKFLSIVAALGGMGGVANAGHKNEIRHKNEICKSSSNTKKLVMGLGGTALLGAFGAAFCWGKDFMKKQKDMNDIMEYLVYYLESAERIFVINDGVISLNHDAFLPTVSANIRKFCPIQDINKELGKLGNVGKHEKNEYKFSIIFSENCVKVRFYSKKEGKPVYNDDISEKITEFVNKNSFLKELVLKFQKKDDLLKKFKENMKNEDKYPVKFVIQKGCNGDTARLVLESNTKVDSKKVYSKIPEYYNYKCGYSALCSDNDFDTLKKAHGPLKGKFEDDSFNIYDKNNENIFNVNDDTNELLEEFKGYLEPFDVSIADSDYHVAMPGFKREDSPIEGVL